VVDVDNLILNLSFSLKEQTNPICCHDEVISFHGAQGFLISIETPTWLKKLTAFV
jgi:hypothetical protein